MRPIPFGNYQLLERLAMGGMAEVYLARNTKTGAADKLVALKRILPNIAEDDEFIAMFIDEAKIAGQLSHQNVAQIFDLGKTNASYFIAMEYVSGHDLRALWDRTRDTGGLPLGLVCYAVRKICDGLDYAHRRKDSRGRPLGIIHRDVSPQNVLISYDGDLKVIDFGIAKAANRMVRTQTGILKGKFAYMAPEQARGEPTDHRADIFAIGVILYELLTGERAFRADSDFALLEKVRRVDLVPPRNIKPELPREIDRIIFKALARDAADRYAWASALGSDLDRFMAEQGLTYNKDELGAYVRRTFREEHTEEMKRLTAYSGLPLEGGVAAEPREATPGRRRDTRPQATGLAEELSDSPEEGGTPAEGLRSQTSMQASFDPETSAHDSEDDLAPPPFDDEQRARNVALRDRALRVARGRGSPTTSVQAGSDESSESGMGTVEVPTLAAQVAAANAVAKAASMQDEARRREGREASPPRGDRAPPRGKPETIIASSSAARPLPRSNPVPSAPPQAPPATVPATSNVGSSLPTSPSLGPRGAVPTKAAPLTDTPSSQVSRSGNNLKRAGGTQQTQQVVEPASSMPSDERYATSVNITPPEFSESGQSEGPVTVLDSGPQKKPPPPPPSAGHSEELVTAEGTASAPFSSSDEGEVSSPFSAGPLSSSSSAIAARAPVNAPLLSVTSSPALSVTDDAARKERGRSDPLAPGQTAMIERQRRARAARGGSYVLIALVVAAAFVVGALSGIWLAARRAPPPIDVVLVSTPRGAEVREGEALVCAKTPCSAHLGNGPHELTFTRGNAAPVTERVEVTTSTVAVVDVSLERRRAGIQLATEPSGATVVLDDRPLPGLTPMPLPELVIGQKVKLRIAKEGFETFDSIVEVKDPGLDPWRFTLPSTTTSWTVTPTPDDAIIDGGGRVHEGALVVSIAHQGSAAYNVLRPGCDPKAVALSGTGRAAEERPVALTCRPFDGSLTIRARRLAVRIDGVDLIKKAPLDAYPLPAGSHAVTLRNAKGRTETVTVEVKRGETFVLQSKLK